MSVGRQSSRNCLQQHLVPAYLRAWGEEFDVAELALAAAPDLALHPDCKAEAPDSEARVPMASMSSSIFSSSSRRLSSAKLPFAEIKPEEIMPRPPRPALGIVLPSSPVPCLLGEGSVAEDESIPLRGLLGLSTRPRDALLKAAPMVPGVRGPRADPGREPDADDTEEPVAVMPRRPPAGAVPGFSASHCCLALLATSASTRSLLTSLASFCDRRSSLSRSERCRRT
eukprot:CAMPEP_0197630792 /NCGR_PEP_ID=MMETSP1338-20131121/8160_1 /TAXON_ID=43686 ORGANISM="Pelagodinium beii, Strain RCC1491" /NCGR_SAMPLE_ID=MMETSP1338 /ASSEMBLY_ACC=CAM_ASM_000754 /LENGTH=226 /DNA_ID=CAMNT_0043202095 /DNA_START=131 /DNA_END=810 /DNA_ORIENTATION=+